MKLLRPLELRDCKIDSVQLVPTKEFFKPVLVFTAPADIAIAALLSAEAVFKAVSSGAVDGSVKLHGALSGAEVTMTSAHQSKEVRSEQVAHVAFYRDVKVDRIRLRIHMSEEDSLTGTLEFLAELNKASFTLTIRDSQGTLVKALVDNEPGKEDPQHQVAQPDGDGYYDEERASKRPFQDGKIQATIFLLETEEGFRSGWRLISKLGGADPMSAGELISKDRLPFPSEREALSLAAREVWLKIPILRPKGPKEQKSVAALDAWVTDLDPALAKAEREPEPEPEPAQPEVVQ